MSSINPKSDWVSRYADGLIRWRWLVIAATVLTAVLATSGARFIAFNNDYRAFFSEENPQLKAFEQLQRTYTKTDNILFAIDPLGKDVFSPEMLEAVEELTAEAWLLPYALRVDSLTNFQHTEVEGDDLLVADLVEGGRGFSAAEQSRVKRISKNEPFLAGQLVNADGSVSGINVTFQMPQKSLEETPEAVSAARALVADIEQRYGVKIHMAGMVMLTNGFFESSINDMSTLVPIMYGVIFLIAFLLLRSVSATFTKV